MCQDSEFWGRITKTCSTGSKSWQETVFRARGETVTDIKIIPSERPALQVLH